MFPWAAGNEIMDEFYFAYGSNLWAEQMVERCPSSVFVARATLNRYRFWFPLTSTRWGGGVAGIEANAMSKVEGVVYSMHMDDVHVLDRYECVAQDMYERKAIAVQLEDDSELTAWTYFSSVYEGAPFETSASYIDTIIRGARAHGLPADWIRFLESFPVGDR